jgi:hypothetical protein
MIKKIKKPINNQSLSHIKKNKSFKKKIIGGKQFIGEKKIKSNNTTRKIGKLKKVNCSPKEKGKINDFTCYTDESLYKLRDIWNARHPDELIHTNDPKEIHSQLTNYMGNICNKESCWLKQKFLQGNVSNDLKDSFAPESPKEWKTNPNEWLSSLDIINVMKQFEKAYKCFDFIGPSPIDFDTKKIYGECVWDELCNFNLADEIKKGKTKIGIIFNTDPHYKPGEHWLSLFINIKKGQIFFFDSVGKKIPNLIMKFVDKIIDQGKTLNPKINFTFDQNYPIEHQYGNTECGIYSIFFIVHMLEDKINANYLKTHILKDNYIENFRKIYFNDSL